MDIDATITTEKTLDATVSKEIDLTAQTDFVNIEGDTIDCFVKVTGSDATADVLYNKLVAGSNATFTVLNPTGSETMRLDVGAGSLYTNLIYLPPTQPGGGEGVIYIQDDFNFPTIANYPFIHYLNRNTCVGKYAGNINMTGNYNTAIGYFALSKNTNAEYNVAIGTNAMSGNTVGDQNTVVGTSALQSNTTGSYNISIGGQSMNTNISGNENIAIGWGAGKLNNAGGNLIGANNSIYLGNFTTGSSNADNNSIVIGNYASGMGTNTVVLGNDSITNTYLKGNVGAVGSISCSGLISNGNATVETLNYTTLNPAIDLSGYVPYEGATNHVSLEGYNLYLDSTSNSFLASDGAQGTKIESNDGYNISFFSGRIETNRPDGLFLNFNQTASNIDFNQSKLTMDINGNFMAAGSIACSGLDSQGNSNVTGLLKCGINSSTDGFGISGCFGGGLVIDGYDDGYGRGGAMFSTRRTQTNEPFLVFTGYDLDNPWESSGQTRQLWYGGTGFGVPDANEHLFFTSLEYNDEDPTVYGQYSPLVFRIVRNMVWLGEHYYFPNYTMDEALPRYKLDIGDGNVRLRGTSVLGFGGDKDTDYSSTLYDDGNFFHINTDKVVDINNQIQMNNANPISLMGNNQIRWWDAENADAYDLTLERTGGGLVLTSSNGEPLRINDSTTQYISLYNGDTRQGWFGMGFGDGNFGLASDYNSIKIYTSGGVNSAIFQTDGKVSIKPAGTPATTTSDLEVYGDNGIRSTDTSGNVTDIIAGSISTNVTHLTIGNNVLINGSVSASAGFSSYGNPGYTGSYNGSGATVVYVSGGMIYNVTT